MDRFTWGIVAGAVLLVIGGLAAVLVLQRPSAPPDLSTPDGVVRAYVTALETGKPEDAWDLLTTGARSGMTRDEFVRRAGAEYRPRSSRVTIESTTIDGSTARVELSRQFDGSGGLFGSTGYAQPSTVRLLRENGAWRIDVPPDPYLLTRPVPPAVVTVVTTAVVSQTVIPSPTPLPAAPARP